MPPLFVLTPPLLMSYSPSPPSLIFPPPLPLRPPLSTTSHISLFHFCITPPPFVTPPPPPPSMPHVFCTSAAVTDSAYMRGASTTDSNAAPQHFGEPARPHWSEVEAEDVPQPPPAPGTLPPQQHSHAPPPPGGAQAPPPPQSAAHAPPPPGASSPPPPPQHSGGAHAPPPPGGASPPPPPGMLAPPPPPGGGEKAARVLGMQRQADTPHKARNMLGMM